MIWCNDVILLVLGTLYMIRLEYSERVVLDSESLYPVVDYIYC